MANDFMVGVCYHPEEWPESDWKRDLAAMHNTGVQLLLIGENLWPVFEPRPGEYNFSLLDKIMALADEADLKVLLSTGTARLPHWLGSQYTEARMTNAVGQHPVAAMNPWCVHHPRAREEARELCRVLANRYGRHNALWGWQIDPDHSLAGPSHENEICCYCENSIKEFRTWAKQQYPRIEDLQAAWNDLSYSDWNEIEPPTVTPEHGGNPTAWLDWCVFRDAGLADFVHDLVGQIQSIDRNHPCGMRVDEQGDITVAQGRHYWWMCGGLGFCGAQQSQYNAEPVIAGEIRAYNEDLFGSIMRANGGLLLNTFPAGPSTLPFQPTVPPGQSQGPKPADIVASLLQAISRGVDLILFDRWRAARAGASMGQHPLVNDDGSPTPRSAALADAIKGLKTIEDLGEPLPHRVAIFMSRLGAITKFGLHESDVQPTDPSTAGVYEAFTDLQVPTGFIDESEIMNGKLSQYEVLVLSEAAVLGGEVAKRIAEYVKGGGKLIVSGHTAVLDERARRYGLEPGAGFAELLKTVVTGTHTTDGSLLSWQPTRVFKTQSQTGVSLYRKSVDTKAGVLAAFDDGSPGVLVSEIGKGAAAYLLFDLGGNYTAESAAAFGSLLQLIFDSIGFSRMLEVSQVGFPSFIEMRMRRNSAGLLLFVHNYSDEPRTAFLKVRPDIKVKRLSDMLARRKVNFIFREGELSFDAELAPNGSGIYQIE